MNITAQKKTLSEIIQPHNHRFVVKPYQRPYSWEKEQREDYWTDIEAMLDGDTDQHFFGSILTINTQLPSGVTERELVDGQQRLTTTLTMFCALRDILEATERQKDIAGFIDMSILKMGIAPNLTSRLTLQGNDHGFFLNHILPKKTDLDLEKPEKVFARGVATSHSQRKLRDCYRYFVERIWERCESKVERLDFFVEEFQKKMFSNVLFIDVVADNLESAYSIFGAMNNRGLPLSAADLIKNTLLERIAGNSVESQELFNQKWVRLNDTIGDGSDLTTFIRHWWLTRSKEKVTKDKLFRLVKASVDQSPSAAHETLDAILDASTPYSQLLEPDRDHVKSYQSYVALKTIADLRASLSYPLLLQARLSLPETLFEDLCIKIESLTVRYSTICKKASKHLENMFQRAANLIRTKGEGAYAEVLAEIRTVMPDDVTVRKEFSEDTPSKNIDVILRRLALTSSDSELQILTGKDVHIEHILPQTPSKEWKAVLPEGGKDFESYCYKWGNLTLLSGKKNTSLQNSVYEKKAELYLKSDIPMTRELPGRFKNWNYDTVNKRTDELADRAVQVWQNF